MGERANFHLLPMAIAALDQILEWGPDRIEVALSARTQGLAKRAAEIGLECVPQDLRAAHFLGLGFPKGIPERLPGSLAEQKVFVSVRGNSVRVTPHLYNTDEDVERLFAALETLM